MIFDPSQNALLLEDFCKHLSTHICVLDMVLISQKFNIPSFDPFMDDPFILPVYDKQIKQKLKDCNYLNFLQEVTLKIKVLDNTLDIFKSYLEKDLLELFISVFNEHINIEIKEHHNGYICHCPTIVSDSLSPVLSILHSEIILTFEQFLDYINALNGDVRRLFLNPKGSTLQSQFIQMWVAHKLSIPAGNYNDLVLVS